MNLALCARLAILATLATACRHAAPPGIHSADANKSLGDADTSAIDASDVDTVDVADPGPADAFTEMSEDIAGPEIADGTVVNADATSTDAPDVQPDSAPAIDASADATAVDLPPECSSCTWTSLPGMDIGRISAGAAWSGADLYVWGGAKLTACCWQEAETMPPGSLGLLATGARWNAKTDKWTPLPQAPLYPNLSPYVVWGGDRLYVYAGGLHQFLGPTPWAATPADGAMYLPETNTWKALPEENSPGHRGSSAVVAWTGKTLIVFGDPPFGQLACTGKKPCPSGPAGAYDPIVNKWTPLPPGPVGDSGYIHGGWTGSRLLVWPAAPKLELWAAWSPQNSTWEKLPKPAGTIELDSSDPAVPIAGGIFFSRPFVFKDPWAGWIWWDDTSQWEAVARPAWLPAWYWCTATFTGKYLVFFGGSSTPHVILYDPVEHVWLLGPSPQPIWRDGSALTGADGSGFMLGGYTGMSLFGDAWRITTP